MDRRGLIVAIAQGLVVMGSERARAAPPSRRGPSKPSDQNEIDALANAFVNGGYGPAISISVMCEGEWVLRRAYGFANLETGTSA